ncbi:hypothetical protein BIW11_10386 [Tropilaelaps mercedesae]|uniref:Uncharacterized protein n=1 Tax=Tropilaelaps mercedesae TaxID=418985 RepID=A0A1V9XFX0_9ACAR|nr:hypothetical protein BIW11_10386 [Tropilaelaps mercedesae]
MRQRESSMAPGAHAAPQAAIEMMAPRSSAVFLGSSVLLCSHYSLALSGTWAGATPIRSKQTLANWMADKTLQCKASAFHIGMNPFFSGEKDRQAAFRERLARSVGITQRLSFALRCLLVGLPTNAVVIQPYQQTGKAARRPQSSSARPQTRRYCKRV